MRFSIVTPSFNSLPKLRRCIGSVRGQSGVEYEHLVIDGGSTDGTVEFLEAAGPRLPEDDGGVGPADAPDRGNTDVKGSPRWLSEPDNGMYDAINKGWSRSGGDILSWLNADEQYLPDALKRVETVFAENPEVDIVFGDAIFVLPNGEPFVARREIPLRGFYLRNGFLYAFSCATFFRRRLLDEGDLVFRSEFRYAGDHELMLRLLSRRRKVLHVSTYLSLFGLDGENLSTRYAAQAKAEAEKIVREYGALPVALRRTARLMRYFERLIRGCYWPDRVGYDFALDEVPTYMQVMPRWLGFRFSYELVERKMKADAS